MNILRIKFYGKNLRQSDLFHLSREARGPIVSDAAARPGISVPPRSPLEGVGIVVLPCIGAESFWSLHSVWSLRTSGHCTASSQHPVAAFGEAALLTATLPQLGLESCIICPNFFSALSIPRSLPCDFTAFPLRGRTYSPPLTLAV